MTDQFSSGGPSRVERDVFLPQSTQSNIEQIPMNQLVIESGAWPGWLAILRRLELLLSKARSQHHCEGAFNLDQTLAKCFKVTTFEVFFRCKEMSDSWTQ